MNIEMIHRIYEQHNPISQYAIRPALKLADAHNNPIRGGITATVASGLAHYGLIEAIGQVSDYFFGTNFRDPQTKMALTNVPLEVHSFLWMSALSNFGVGIGKYFQRR